MRTFNLSNLLSAFALMAIMSHSAYSQKPSSQLLNPDNHTLVLIDNESQMAFAASSIDVMLLRTNTGLVAGASKIFKVPTVVTTVAAKSFSGPVFPEVTEFYPEASSNYLDRTTMNTWEDVNVHKAITAKGRKKIVFGGLWTSVCIVGPALSAKDEGFDVYVITDICGDVSGEAHERAIQRMVQAGVKPMTATQYLLELQRDWARQTTYQQVTELVTKYGGAYGVGVQYAHEMVKH